MIRFCEMQGLRENVQGQLLQEFLIFVLVIILNKTVTNIACTLCFLNFDHM